MKPDNDVTYIAILFKFHSKLCLGTAIHSLKWLKSNHICLIWRSNIHTSWCLNQSFHSQYQWFNRQIQQTTIVIISGVFGLLGIAAENITWYPALLLCVTSSSLMIAQSLISLLRASSHHRITLSKYPPHSQSQRFETWPCVKYQFESFPQIWYTPPSAVIHL